MLRIATLMLTLAASLLSRAEARLWETVAQTEARFGRPVKISRSDTPGEEDRRYAWKHFRVLVTYVSGRSENELYMHQDTKPFSDAEVRSLLKMSSVGRWDQPRSEPMWYLISSDGKTQIAAAAYYPKLPRVNAPAFTALTATYARRHKLINI